MPKYTVPLKNGVTELEEGTVVMLDTHDLVFIQDGSFMYPITCAFSPWKDHYVVKVYEECEISPAEPILPQSIGAILKSTRNPSWYMIRVSDTEWYSSSDQGCCFNSEAVRELSHNYVYVLSEGI